MEFTTIEGILAGRRELDLKDYLKHEMLEDGKWVTMRPMVRTDELKLLEYFKGLSERERLCLREDVVDARVIRNWVRNLDYEKVLPLLAIAEDRIVGDCSLHRYPGTWMRNTGHISITVSPEFRQNGLIGILAGEVFYIAMSTRLQRITVELTPDRKDLREVFAGLGFTEETVLVDKHLDLKGNRHDLLVMNADFDLLWRGWMDHYELASGA